MVTKTLDNRAELRDFLDSMFLPFKERIDLTHKVPDVIQFVTSDRFLDRPNLYPRQATLLKIMFLQRELFTPYDYDVIGEWEESYRHTADESGEGNNGIPPGTLERIDINRLCPCGHDWSDHAGVTYTHESGAIGQRCIARDCSCTLYRGRRWFRETVSVIGRRGSKGHIGALAGAYVLWHFHAKGDPQQAYGIDRDKRLAGVVFGGKKEQAKAHQWADLTNVILGAPCYAPYISRSQAESLTINSLHDTEREKIRKDRKIQSTADMATFEIIPKESTKMAGRGAAAFMQFYDEAAHVVKGTANVPAEEVYEAATPALDQFGVDGFIYLPSSPWQRIGLFHDHYQQAIEMEVPEGAADRWVPEAKAVYPEKFMVQLTSWDPYVDWEIAHDYLMKPLDQIKPEEKRHEFQPLAGPIQTYDNEMKQIERANPETFKVERRSHFASVMDAYLNPDRIEQMWKPWPTESDALTMKSMGMLSKTYRAHGDPSKSGANFGFAIAHIESHDERGLPHVVFDLIHNWDPADFENHEVDYDQIGSEIEEWMDAFMPTELTFDQFNSVSTVQRLQKRARKMNYPKRVTVYERPATGPLNWKTYETFKTALGLGLIHAPFHELASLELTFLQDLGRNKVDAPTAGPVQTKDVADCLAIVTYELIGEEMSAFLGKALGDLDLGTAAQGGMDAYREARPETHEALSSFNRGRRSPHGARRGPSR